MKVKVVYCVGIDIFLLTFRVGESELNTIPVINRLLLIVSRLIFYELEGPQCPLHNIILASRNKVLLSLNEFCTTRESMCVKPNNEMLSCN